MTELLIGPLERSRKALTRVLAGLQEPGSQVGIAAVIGVHESTVSRIKTQSLEGSMALLYAAGWKVVSSDKVCVSADELRMLRAFYARAVNQEELAARLFGDDE